MKHNAKKILTMLLTLVIVLGLSATAYADSLAGTVVTKGDSFTLNNEWVEYFTGQVQPETVSMTLDNIFYWDFYQCWTFQFIPQLNYGIVGPDTTTPIGFKVVSGDGQSEATAYKLALYFGQLSLTPANATINVGSTTTLTASVTPNNAPDKKVKWSVGGTNAGAVKLYSDAACEHEITSDATDTLTVYAKGISAGSATVSATMNADNTEVKTCTVTVNAAAYTVTYIANNGTNEKVVEDNRAAGDYIIQAYDKNFTVPDGEVFDYWKGSDGGKYRDEQTIQLTGDLTLTAQWKEEKKPDGGEKKTSGGGSGFDLVFNIPGEDNSWEYVGGGYAPQQAYRVSLAPMQGGSAALGLTTGDSGTALNVYPSTTVYVFPNAEQGYTLDKIVWSLIDGSASYDITEAKNFVMPAMDVVVYVTFRPVG